MVQATTTDVISIAGARENNLKNVSLEIPKRQITVFTGVSGSGKSSLVFDTIAAEAQRQLNETFSAFVRNFLPNYGQPDLDSIEGLSAAIVVDQKRIGGMRARRSAPSLISRRFCASSSPGRARRASRMCGPSPSISPRACVLNATASGVPPSSPSIVSLTCRSR